MHNEISNAFCRRWKVHFSLVPAWLSDCNTIHQQDRFLHCCLLCGLMIRDAFLSHSNPSFSLSLCNAKTHTHLRQPKPNLYLKSFQEEGKKRLFFLFYTAIKGIKTHTRTYNQHFKCTTLDTPSKVHNRGFFLPKDKAQALWCRTSNKTEGTL